MGLATGTAKTLLFVFNFLFFVSGIAIIVVGGLVLNEQKSLEEKVDFSTLSGAPIVLIVVGVFIMFISFFGCYGAISSSYCMLMTFAGLLILIFILEFAAGIAAYVNKDSIKDSFKKGLQDVESDKDRNLSNPNDAWNELQKEWDCCGVESATEYNDTIPGSCCGLTPPLFCTEPADFNKATNKTGCYEKIGDIISKNVVVIGGVGVGIAFIQILGITLACCLGTNVKNHL